MELFIIYEISSNNYRPLPLMNISLLLCVELCVDAIMNGKIQWRQERKIDFF